MMSDEILKIVFALLTGTLGYFLRDTAVSLKEVRKMADNHEVRLAVLEADRKE